MKTVPAEKDAKKTVKSEGKKKVKVEEEDDDDDDEDDDDEDDEDDEGLSYLYLFLNVWSKVLPVSVILLAFSAGCNGEQILNMCCSLKFSNVFILSSLNGVYSEIVRELDTFILQRC